MPESRIYYQLVKIKPEDPKEMDSLILNLTECHRVVQVMELSGNHQHGSG